MSSLLLIASFVICGRSFWPGAVFAAEGGCLGAAVEVTAASVANARSLQLADGRTLRLAGIEPFGLLVSDHEAAEAALRQRLSELTSGAVVEALVLAEEPDRYGRVPAMIEVDGRLVQEILAGEGLAIAFASGGDSLPCFDRILAAENAARTARRGYWDGEPLPAARPGTLGARIGHFAIIEGRVVSVGNRTRRTYLNFGHYWKEDVTAEIAGEDREKFGGEAALSELSGRRVRLRGYLEEKDGPLMMLRSPMQLEVLDPPADADRIPP